MTRFQKSTILSLLEPTYFGVELLQQIINLLHGYHAVLKKGGHKLNIFGQIEFLEKDSCIWRYILAGPGPLIQYTSQVVTIHRSFVVVNGVKQLQAMVHIAIIMLQDSLMSPIQFFMWQLASVNKKKVCHTCSIVWHKYCNYTNFSILLGVATQEYMFNLRHCYLQTN